jgi:hypothetical protein
MTEPRVDCKLTTSRNTRGALRALRTYLIRTIWLGSLVGGSPGRSETGAASSHTLLTCALASATNALPLCCGNAVG